MSQAAATRLTGLVNLVVTSVLLVGVTLIIVGSAARWAKLLRPREAAAS
jgi:hypothetical protein